MPETMRAAAIDQFGGIDELEVKQLPIPNVGPDEVLIRNHCAGIGVWDPFEMSGGFHEEGVADTSPNFPYVPGSDCAGTVVAVGDRVDRCAPGDRVYAFTLGNPKGGSYAEYVAISQDRVSKIPEGMGMAEAGVLPTDAITALRGLDDELGVSPGDSVMIFGANGGIGHLAIQLAKRMGAQVFAIASGDDGVELAERLGADAAVNGRNPGIVEEALGFAPEGLNAALVTAGGETTDRALEAIREGGKVAYPTGVLPEPQARPGVTVRAYDGIPDPAVIDKLNELIASGPFEVVIDRSFDLDHATDALKAAETHHLGKLALKLDGKPSATT